MRNAAPLPDKGALTDWLQRYFIVAVVPAYRVQKEIEGVLRSMPAFVKKIIVVNDASPDQTAAIVAKLLVDDGRVILLNQETNQGVGGAMVTGFCQGLRLGVQLVVKVDRDVEMDV